MFKLIKKNYTLIYMDSYLDNDNDMTTNISDLRNPNSNMGMKEFAKQLETSINNIPKNNQYNENNNLQKSNISLQQQINNDMYNLQNTNSLPNQEIFNHNMNNFNQRYISPQNQLIQQNNNPRAKQVLSTTNIIFSYIREPVIVSLIFTLLAHRKISKFISRNISFFSEGKNQLISLLIRGLLFSLILIVIKHKLD